MNSSGVVDSEGICCISDPFFGEKSDSFVNSETATRRHAVNVGGVVVYVDPVLISLEKGQGTTRCANARF